jgi:hypothetical protein
VSTFSPAYRPGWLLFAGNLGADVVIAGQAYGSQAGVRHGMSGTSVSISADLDRPVIHQGRPLEAMVWEAFQSWPDERAGQRWPPEVLALLALARNHPEEYERLRESEAVLRALGGLSCGSGRHHGGLGAGAGPVRPQDHWHAGDAA